MYASVILFMLSLINNIPTAIVLFTKVFTGGYPQLRLGPLSPITGLAVSVGMVLTTLFILVPSLNSLRNYFGGLDTSVILVKIGYLVGPILYIISSIATLAAMPYIHVGFSRHGLNLMRLFTSPPMLALAALTAVAGILIMVGLVGMAVASFKLCDYLKISSFIAAAILFIIGIIVNFLRPVAWALMIVATYKALRTSPPQVSKS